MKVVFFIEAGYYADVKNIVYADDLVSRQSINFREAKSLGFDKNGYYLEIDGSEEAIRKAKEIIGEKGKEITGEEKKKVLAKIKEQEESADAGFGALFG
jgi:hypothetical protein